MKNSSVRILSALAMATIACASVAAESRRPNVLIIVADDLGYGELGIQGNPQIPTPQIDSLARNGVRFTSGYVSGPYCSPTRAGLMTGRYQQRFGHEFNPGPVQDASIDFGLSLKEVTIANHFKKAGYATGWFGKSHLGYEPQFHPLKRGFDEFYGFLGGAHSYLKTSGDYRNAILRGTNPVERIDYATEAFAREAVDFIDRHKASPWLVYLPFNAVHAPLEATEKYLSRFKHIEDSKRRSFAAMLSALDDAVGSVLAKIRALGLEEDTLIFFFSDNGGPTAQITSGNGPLRGFKAQTWEGGIRVPWMVQWRGHLPSGKVDDRPVIQLDILPTALAAAGIEIKPEWKLDGVNLLPYLTGKNKAAPHDALYWRFGGQLAIRRGDWKLVKGIGSPSLPESWTTAKATTDGAELYHLAQDIGEKTNVAAANPEKVRELAAAWNAWSGQLIEPAWVPNRQERRNRAAANETRNVERSSNEAAASGPWKLGDEVSGDKAPRIAGRAFTVSAEIEPAGRDGVIIAHGASRNGYALFVRDGRLAFAVRSERKLTTVTAAESLGSGRYKVEARLAAGGQITLTVNGKPVAEGQVPGLIATDPVRGLIVGRNDHPVGDYPGPSPFSGKIENVRVKAL